MQELVKYNMEKKTVNRYTKISAEAKAEIVSALLAGVGVCELERRTNISKASISKIKQELESDNQTLVDDNVKDRIDDLLINSLKVHLHGMESIARLAQDESYTKAQRAGDLAELHAELRTWSIQLLEAAAPDNQSRTK